ncbi:hypothetical protein [Streptomyces sp. NPDC050535]|uniref:hypothetical protein n=1 Tax=Streptomyces sp. NPDC050535 TaxID=3365626 RepID=UPI0037B7BA79
MGDLRVSPEWNAFITALIGAGFIEASETGAKVSGETLDGFGRRMASLENEITYSVRHIGDSLPGDAGREYVRAMSVLTGSDGGVNHLQLLERNLKEVAAGHRDQSLNIQESKWQIVAELIRLLIELTILAATAWFNPAAGGQAVAAKVRSRAAFLTALDLFLRRSHLLPSLSEALEEAFQTLIVRLGLMAFNEPDMKPHGVDWKAVLQSAAFGGAAGWLSGPLRGLAEKFNRLFGKGPGQGLTKNLSDDVASKAVRNPPAGGNNSRSVMDSVTSSPNKVSEFVADGLTEALPESLLAMAFFGTPWSWSAFGMAFALSGTSELTTGMLHQGVASGVGDLRQATVGNRGTASPAPAAKIGTVSGSGGYRQSAGRGGAPNAVNSLDALDSLGREPGTGTVSGVGATQVRTAPTTTPASHTRTESAEAPRETHASGTRSGATTSTDTSADSARRAGVTEAGRSPASAVSETARTTSTAPAEGSRSQAASASSERTPSSPTTAGTNRAVPGAPAETSRPATASSPASPATAAEPPRSAPQSAPNAARTGAATTGTAGTTATTSESARPSSASALPSEATRTDTSTTPPPVRPAVTETGAGETSRTQTSPSIPDQDALRSRLSDEWQTNTPGPDDLTLAHNIVRTHQVLTAFEPGLQPAFDAMDPGHLAVYAVALDLRVNNDIDQAEALSRRLAVGRPRAVRGYLPGGSGRRQPDAARTARTVGGSGDAARTGGPRGPRQPEEHASRRAVTDPSVEEQARLAAEAARATPAAGRRLPATPVPPRSLETTADVTEAGRTRTTPAVEPGRGTAVPGAERRRPAGSGTAPTALTTSPSAPTTRPTGPRSATRPVTERPSAGAGRRRPDPALPAFRQRDVVRTVSVEDVRYQVLQVEPDGDCFFTSVLANSTRQLADSPLSELNVQQLRERVAGWLAGDTPAAEAQRRNLDSGPTPLLTLLNDLPLNQLEDLLGHRAAELTPGELARIEEDLSRPQYPRELTRRFDAPTDRAIVGDFTVGMAARLLPDFTPDPALVRPQDRARLAADRRLAAMRAEAARLLSEVTPRSEAAYSLLADRYRGIARLKPRLRDLLDLTPSAAAQLALRNTDMWATPFYDQVPQLTAVALGLNITAVQTIRGLPRDMAFANPLNPSAPQSLYLYYEDDHYSAMTQVGGPVPVHRTQMIAEDAQPTESPESELPPAAPWNAAVRPGLEPLAAALRAHEASENLVARLNDLSPAAVEQLGAMLASGAAVTPDTRSQDMKAASLDAAAIARQRRRNRSAPAPAFSTAPVTIAFPDRSSTIAPDDQRQLDTLVELIAEQALSNRLLGTPLPVIHVAVARQQRSRLALPGAASRTLDGLRGQATDRYLRDRLTAVLDDKQSATRRFRLTGDDFRIETDTAAEPIPRGTAAVPARGVAVTVQYGPGLTPAQEEAAPEFVRAEWDHLAHSVSPRRDAALLLALTMVRNHQRVVGFRPDSDPDFGELPLSHRAVYAVAAAIVRNPRDVAAAEELSRDLATHQPQPRRTQGAPATSSNPPASSERAPGRFLPVPPPPSSGVAPDVDTQGVSGGVAFGGSSPGVTVHRLSPMPASGESAPALPSVPSWAGELSARIRSASPADLVSSVAILRQEERAWLASEAELVSSLRESMSAAEFANVAAALLLDVHPGVHQPVSARREAYRLISALLANSDVAARLLASGSRVVIVPRDLPMTALEPFASLAGRELGDGRVWDDVRGGSGRVTAITEENLLGETTPFANSVYEDRYSTTVHEVVHAVERHGLTDTDRRLINEVFTSRLAQGPDSQWPDGPRRDKSNKEVDNYSAKNAHEYFAQLTNAYLGVNHGHDPFTKQPRNNGADWVRAHEKRLLPLLRRLYGNNPRVVATSPANPVAETREENEKYAAVRALFGDTSTKDAGTPSGRPTADGGAGARPRGALPRVAEEGVTLPPPPVYYSYPAPDMSVGDLTRWNGPLTPAQTDSVQFQVRTFLNTARLSAARIMLHRLTERSAALIHTQFEAEAQWLEQWVSQSLDAGHHNPSLATPPKIVNFFWIGRPMNLGAVGNILDWAQRAKDHGWVVNLWTDTNPAYPGGPRLSTWHEPTYEMLVQAGVRFRSVDEALPPNISVTPGHHALSPEQAQLVKLRTIYNNARTNPGAFPIGKDVAQLAILFRQGGVFSDVDITPGQADMFSAPRKMGRSDLPLIGPMFRDERTYQDQRVAMAALLGIPPDHLTQADVALHAMADGRYGNAFMMTVPHTSFFSRAINLIDNSVTSWNGQELATSGVIVTGPVLYARAATAQADTYQLGMANGEYAKGVDPYEMRRWSHVGWLTDESENQVDLPGAPGAHNPFSFLPAPPASRAGVQEVSGGVAFGGGESDGSSSGVTVHRISAEPASVSGDAVSVSGDALSGQVAVPSWAGELSARIRSTSPADLVSSVAILRQEERAWLASEAELVSSLRESMSAAEFANVAAALLLDVHPGVHQPVSARREAYRLISALLANSDVAARLLASGSRVVIVPRDLPMTALEPFASLAGRELGDGRVWDDVRGGSGRVTAITEENLLGEMPALSNGTYADSYSTTVHETAHAVERYGLTAAERRLIGEVFAARRAGGLDVQWPDGPRRDKSNKEVDNYSAKNAHEFFAQLTNAYLGVNHGHDPFTKQPRNNGADWVRAHEKRLLSLLRRLYGNNPRVGVTSPANPVTTTREENEKYAAVRALFGDTSPDETEPASEWPTTHASADSLPHGIGPATHLQEVEILPPPPVVYYTAPPVDTPVGDLTKWNGPLTQQQTDLIMAQVGMFLGTARLSAVRIMQHRLADRGTALARTPFGAEAQRLRLWTDQQLQAPSYNTALAAPPKRIHFFWIGRPMSPGAIGNILDWAQRARDHGWVVNLWTDTAPAYPGGPMLSTWYEEPYNILLQAGVRFRSVDTALPPGIQVTPGNQGFTPEQAQLVKLRTIYNNARTNPAAFPIGKDVAQLAILLREGGVFSDVDITPGRADMFSDPRKMSRSDIPLIGPMFRDQRTYDHQRANLARLLRTPVGRLTQADVALHAMADGRYGNAFMMTVPQSAFFRRAIDAIPHEVTNWDGQELASSGVIVTGPALYARAATAQADTYQLGMANGEYAKGVDPYEMRRWSHVGWITDESENQVDHGVALGPHDAGGFQPPPPVDARPGSPVSGGAVFSAREPAEDDSGSRSPVPEASPVLTPETTEEAVRSVRRALAEGSIPQLPAEQRRMMGADPLLMSALMSALGPRGFARLAAELMVVVPAGAQRAPSARRVAHDMVARVLSNAYVARRLLQSGVQVLVLPKSTPVTDFPEFRHLRDLTADDGRSWNGVRALQEGGLVVVSEENLLGELGLSGARSHGASDVPHELAHAIHQLVLGDEAKRLIETSYVNRQKRGYDAPWPDGIRRDLLDNPMDNYSATDVLEYFAQVSAAYFGVNAGRDGDTLRVRSNGAEWVEANVPELMPLLVPLYGPVAEARFEEVANPVDRTVREDEAFDGVRALFGDEPDGVDGVVEPDALSRQLRQVATPPPDADRLLRELPGLDGPERLRAIASLDPEHRRWLSVHQGFVDTLRSRLQPPQFAETAAQLMLDAPDGLAAPETSPAVARALFARLLMDPDVASRLLGKGSYLVVLPDRTRLTELPQLRHLRGKTHGGLRYDDVTTLGNEIGMVVPERQFLGGGAEASVEDRVREHGDVTHALAGTVFLHGVSDDDRLLVDAAYRARMGRGPDAPWPDGIRRDRNGAAKDNYASINPATYFVQLSRSYLGLNAGHDPNTGRLRANTAAWVTAHEPALLPLLNRLYGSAPPTSAPAALSMERPQGTSGTSIPSPQRTHDTGQPGGTTFTGEPVTHRSAEPGTTPKRPTVVAAPRSVLGERILAAPTAADDGRSAVSGGTTYTSPPAAVTAGRTTAPAQVLTPLQQSQVAHAAQAVRELAARGELASMPVERRRQLSLGISLVDRLKTDLPAAEFARLAAQLLVEVPAAVGQAASARVQAHRIVAHTLGNADAAAALLTRGVRVVVLPKDMKITDLPQTMSLRGRKTATGRSVENTRGISMGTTVVIPEENLLGEPSAVGEGAAWSGDSTAVHEMAHALMGHALTAHERDVIDATYLVKRGAGPDASWPDGIRRDILGNPTDNYSSIDADEYFAQVVTAYMGAHAGYDPSTYLPVNNGADWVKANEPALVPILRRLFGSAEQARLDGPVNPTDRTTAEELAFDAVREWFGDSPVASLDRARNDVVRPANAEGLLRELPQRSPQERASVLAGLRPEHRRWLSVHHGFVDTLESRLDAHEFAATAARLMVEVPSGSETAGRQARDLLARLLADPEVTARLLKSGTAVTVLPPGTRLVDLPAFQDRRGTTEANGVQWDRARSAGGITDTVIAEESLPAPADALRILAQTLYSFALSVDDRRRMAASFRARKALGQDAPWPDGVRRDMRGTPTENLSSRLPLTYFIQLTSVYLGMNSGYDSSTGRPRANGAAWIATHEPKLMPLFQRLYGTAAATGTGRAGVAPVQEPTVTGGASPATGRFLPAPGPATSDGVFPVSEGTVFLTQADQPNVPGGTGETDEVPGTRPSPEAERPIDKPLTVRFPRGSRWIEPDQDRDVRALARRIVSRALRDRAEGRKPQAIRVIGRGNSTDHAAYTGRTRAKNTARILEGHLAAALRELQGATADPLTTSRLDIQYGFEDTSDQNRVDPVTRRTATVVLGDDVPDGIEWTSLREPGSKDRHERAETALTVVFGKGGKDVPAREARRIEDLAQRIAVRAVRDRARGLRPPEIRVAGRGNSRDSAETTGLLRASNTRAELQRWLDLKLAELQPAATEPLTVRDLTFEDVFDDAPRALYEDPLTRRTATVTVDWPDDEAADDRSPNPDSVVDRPAEPDTLVMRSGTVLVLRPVLGAGDGFVEAAMEAVRDSELETVWYREDGTPHPDVVDSLRASSVAELSEADLPEPSPDFSPGPLSATAEELRRIGMTPQEIRLLAEENGTVTVGPDELTPLLSARLRLLRSNGWDTATTALAVTALARLLLLDLTVVDRDTGTETTANAGRTRAVLVRDDGRFRFAVPRPDEDENRAPSIP